MKIEKTIMNSGVPVFSIVHETAQGGFTLGDTAISDGIELKPGTVIGFDESTRKAKVCKIAVAQATAANNALTYRLKKGHLLKVGSSVKLATGAAQAIAAIDTSNANYDEITVATTLGIAVAVGDAIYVDDAGFSGVKGLLYDAVTIKGETPVAVVLRGTVWERRISPIPGSIKTQLPFIIFSQSF